METNIHEGHRDRVRTKILADGLNSFNDHEIIEYLLYSFIPRKDTNPIAHRLINQFDSVAGIFDAQIEELIKIEGLPMNAAIFIISMRGFFDRYKQSKFAPKLKLDTYKKTCEYLHSYLSFAIKEEVYVLCLNAKNDLLKIVHLSTGTVNSVDLYIREVGEIALRNGAVNVILAHNHPSGSPEPSTQDIEVTTVAHIALRMLNITLLDHIIIAGEDSFSFRNSGKIKQIHSELEEKLGSTFF